MTKNEISRKDLKLLSNYLDGQLTAAQQLKVAARLQKEAALSTALAELKQTRYLIKKAKPMAAPRSFTLTPEIAAQLKPAKRPFALPILSISSALAAILMVFAILFETLPASNLGQFMKNEPRTDFAMDAAAEEMQPMAAAPAMETEQASAENSTALDLSDLQGNPPIINWGGGGYGSGGGGDRVEGLGGAAPETMAESPMDTYPLDTPPMDMPLEEALPEEPEMDIPTASQEEEPPMTITAKSLSEPITGTGPILGIPSEAETDAYNQTVFEILEQENLAYQQFENRIPPIRFLQIGLGLIALSTALAAIWLYRKSSL